MGRYLAVFLALIAVIAGPVLMKPKTSARTKDFAPQDRLVIITPHVESIRNEFEAAFQRWMKEKHGRSVVIDWRVPGGTTEISKVVGSEYRAALEFFWNKQGKEAWNDQLGVAAFDSKDTSPARAAWLASSIGIGIDVLFGGGTPDFSDMKKKGYLVAGNAAEGIGLLGVKAAHPDWFGGSGIPDKWAGETYLDPDFTWAGACLSSFGICYNLDFHQRRGFTDLPDQWADLTHPRYQNQIALADPGKSGTVAKMMESLLQQAMQTAAKDAPDAAARKLALETGWLQGMGMIQRIGANARYFTDSSQKPPIDVSQGDCAVGICIDFYGRSQAEVTGNRGEGEPRLGFASPRGGTVSSVDPIAVLRGAPHRDVAERFIEFTLSMEGQKLWNFQPGTPGGVTRFALRRLPVRRDYYTQKAWKQWRSDPDAEPFAETEKLVYQPVWTGGVFREMAFIIRITTLDTHKDLVRAWRAINQAPETRRISALAVLQDLSSVSYDAASQEIKRALTSKNKVDEITLARDLAQSFRVRYQRAERIALGRE